MKMTMSQRRSLRHMPGSRAAGVAAVLSAALWVAGCKALPDKPQRMVQYDFGPGVLAAPAPEAAVSARPALVLADLDTSASRLEGTALHYRLGYADAQELRPYAGARWAQPPQQLFRQRLRDGLVVQRTVLGTLEAANLARDARNADILRVSLDEFSHYFASPSESVGLVRVRATLVRGSAAGERVVGQQVFTLQRPALSADAAGGAQALAAASDAAVAQIVAWVTRVAPVAVGAAAPR